MSRPLDLQLWSYNYDPEPTGIAPVSSAWARAMRDRGHRVHVVAAHPHYPVAQWGQRARPYREVRDGVRVTRLPLWVGRSTTAARVRQELSYAAVLGLAGPAIPRPDAIVAVSPCFPALLPTMLHTRLRRVPWVLWLQDILPEGAETTGLLENRLALGGARWLERTAYRSAEHLVVISDSFRRNVVAKGVPEAKVTRLYNPSTRPLPDTPRSGASGGRLLIMGNLGRSQGVHEIVEAVRSSDAFRDAGGRLVITGSGVALEEVREAAADSDAVEVLGLVDDAELERQLRLADIAVVTQRHDVAEFNLPSKLMNYMAYGLPVLASVRPDSEVARLLERSGGGWSTDSRDPAQFAARAAELLSDAGARERLGRAGAEFAAHNFTPEALAEGFERVLSDSVG